MTRNSLDAFSTVSVLSQRCYNSHIRDSNAREISSINERWRSWRWWRTEDVVILQVILALLIESFAILCVSLLSESFYVHATTLAMKILKILIIMIILIPFFQSLQISNSLDVLLIFRPFLLFRKDNLLSNCCQLPWYSTRAGVAFLPQ